jgi:DNA-binding transcriptional ArsR family regulator
MEESWMYEGLFSSSQAKVLSFLCDHIGQSYYEGEIAEQSGVSRSAVNLATRALYQAGLLLRERRGRMNFYMADDRHPVVRQFKVLNTVARLEPILQELRPLAHRVILFGSSAKGDDMAESDIDLFVLARDRRQVMAAIRQHLFGRSIQPMIVNSQELATIKESEPAFYAQVQQGITLWEATNELAA